MKSISKFLKKIQKTNPKNLLNIKNSKLENYNEKDFLNYNFYTNHQTRAYFKVENPYFINLFICHQ